MHRRSGTSGAAIAYKDGARQIRRNENQDPVGATLMMRIVLSAALAATLLAACGQAEEKSPAPTAAPPASQAAPAPMPAAPGAAVINGDPAGIRTLAYAPLYPGSTVTKSAVGDSGVGAGGDVTFTTPDPPARVIAFYKDQAKAAGVTVTMDQNLGPALMMSAGDSGDGKGAFQVLASQQGGQTEGQLTWADK
jgi:hypothetical protein